MAWTRKTKPTKSELTFTCGETERPFVVIIEDDDPGRKSQIVGIKRVEETRGRSLIPRLRKPAKQQIDTDAIDWTKFYCPWCGADKQTNGIEWVCCGECRGFFCSHAVRQKAGEKWGYWGGHPSCRDSAGPLVPKDLNIDASDAKNPPKNKPKGKPIPPPDRLKITKK